VKYLAEFVDSLDNPILPETLDELKQTVNLMNAESPDEFYDVSSRNKKYGRVDPMSGPILLEKYDVPSCENSWSLLLMCIFIGSLILLKVQLKPTNFLYPLDS
jgi:Exocyst complex subunit Sec15-like